MQLQIQYFKEGHIQGSWLPKQFEVSAVSRHSDQEQNSEMRLYGMLG